MTDFLERRNFLKSAGAVAAGSLSLALGAGAQSTANESKSASPRFFSGCCAYSYRKLLADGPMTVQDFILKAVELEVDGIEIATEYLKSTEESYLLDLRRIAFRNGVMISGTATNCHACIDDPPVRAAEIRKIKHWIDVTSTLGASHLSVLGGDVPEGAPDSQGVQWVVETMKPTYEYAEKKGVLMGIQNNGGSTSRGYNIVQAMKGMGNTLYAGCNLDVGNFSENPYEQIEMCVPYATNVHIRSTYGNHPKKPLDLDRVFQIFAKAGYKGFVSVDSETDGNDPLADVPKQVAVVKALCKKYSAV
ncbi:MAG: TIM barrel protein [Bryobacteraceae bacterium]|jgi:sugar phosphate isomerase/epimerase